jgi:hypothetical protein
MERTTHARSPYEAQKALDTQQVKIAEATPAGPLATVRVIPGQPVGPVKAYLTHADLST